jgi:glycerol uptake facilitator-like aquaporin
LCPNFAAPTAADPCDPSNEINLIRAFLVEFLATFLFVSYQISGIYNQLAPDIVQNAMGTAVAFMALLSVSQGQTRPCLNPYFALV